MSLNETMTDLMNAIRNKYGLTNKLAIADATNLITNQIEMANVLDQFYINFVANYAIADIKSGIVRFTGNGVDQSGHTGTFWLYPNSFVRNKRCRFYTLIRGNTTLFQFGDESNQQRYNIKLNPTEWYSLTCDFVAERAFVIYSKPASKGEWFEIKNYYFAEL